MDIVRHSRRNGFPENQELESFLLLLLSPSLCPEGSPPLLSDILNIRRRAGPARGIYMSDEAAGQEGEADPMSERGAQRDRLRRSAEGLKAGSRLPRLLMRPPGWPESASRRRPI